MDTKITPLPWRYVRENGSPTTGQHMISGAKPGYLAEVRDCGSGDVEANAAFIVKAVNTHATILAALKEARRAIGDHHAPNDCYATGPLTGDEYRDLVECPACSAIALYEEAIAAAEGK